MTDEVIQVQDDFAALEQMMADMEAANELYRPTNYWQLYETRTMEEIRKFGLENYRRRADSVFAPFGAVDNAATSARINLKYNRYLWNRITRRLPFWQQTLDTTSRGLTQILGVVDGRFNLTAEHAIRLAYDLASQYGREADAKPLSNIGTAKAGNPKDLVSINGHDYTEHFIRFYLRYVYCVRFFDFGNADLIVELGSGSGQQAEVLHKLYPEKTILLFDIAPQLYICQQYLKTIFPGEVVTYDQCRGRTGDEKLKAGKIYIFGAWHFPIVASLKPDLFISSASFAEMEPHVVRNYLSFVNATARNVMLVQKMDGKDVASRKGYPGVLKKTVFSDYQNGLPDFELVDRSNAPTPLRTPGGHQSTFWRRRAGV